MFMSMFMFNGIDFHWSQGVELSLSIVSISWNRETAWHWIQWFVFMVSSICVHCHLYFSMVYIIHVLTAIFSMVRFTLSTYVSSCSLPPSARHRCASVLAISGDDTNLYEDFIGVIVPLLFVKNERGAIDSRSGVNSCSKASASTSPAPPESHNSASVISLNPSFITACARLGLPACVFAFVFFVWRVCLRVSAWNCSLFACCDCCVMIAVVVFGRWVSARLWLCREIAFVEIEDEEWASVLFFVGSEHRHVCGCCEYNLSS